MKKKNQLFNIVFRKVNAYMKIIKLDPNFPPHKNMSSKWIKDKHKTELIKLRKTIFLGDYFMDVKYRQQDPAQLTND